MNNLEQIRAINAFEAATQNQFRGAHDGEVVKKIPAQIRQNGLLGALAFAKENDEKKTGHADVFRALIRHLASLKRLPGNIKDLDALIRHLGGCDEGELRTVTAEAMAYLNYLRRFAQKGNGARQEG
ncbi:MAG: hypothetical protein GX608_03505 [Lentisphaerae bacterium]|nr:hypothetical protein [Lentisphaerota bacterium]